MHTKPLPFDLAKIESIAKDYPTPFHIYDEKGIRENARRLKAAFAWNEGFHEFYAVKAAPNPYLLKMLKEEGFGGDCSSLAELVLCEKVGITGENIMFTSNETPSHEYKKALQLNAIVNLDDFSHIAYLEKNCLEKNAGFPQLISFRFNPGPLRTGNAIIGNPREAKYGFMREQLFEGYRICKEKGVSRFGLHSMVVSNELNIDFFFETARMLFELAGEIAEKIEIELEFVNMGGGIGIPYKPEDEAVDLEKLSEGIRQLYDETIVPKGLHPLKLYMENGRIITGPYGFLVTRAIHTKRIYKNYVGVDACMANLMRPGIYGAYHHVTVLGKENAAENGKVDIVGSLCENNDKFAIDRDLPPIAMGDYLVIHDTGAHGHAMGFQYNGKLRSAELLLKEDGSVQQIRRAETLDDYFATLDFSGVS